MPTPDPVAPQPIGVAAAFAAKDHPGFICRPQAFDEFSQAGNVALVTGGSEGIGLEVCQVLLEAGARAVYAVDLASYPSEAWTVVKSYVKNMGLEGRLEYMQGDVSDQRKMLEIGESIGEKEGKLDVAVAGAGIGGSPCGVLETSAEEYGKVIDVNLKGVLYTAQAAIQQMEKFQVPGSIVLIGSIAGSFHLKNTEALGYQTSKAAVIQLARDLACMLAPKNIRVNSLSPGWTRTNMIKHLLDSDGTLRFIEQQSPMNRIAMPHEMRGPILWLASKASSFCTGSDIIVSGGYHAWGG